MARLLFDLTGLLHWYAYFGRPAGVQRVIEQVGSSPLLQAAARRSTTAEGEAVEFVVRLLGSDRFCRLSPKLLADLIDNRPATVARLRRLFAATMRQATLGGLCAEARYVHLPYIALGLTRLDRLLWPSGRENDALLPPVEPPGAGDAVFSPGDLWWQKGYAAAVAGLKRRTGLGIVQMVHDLYVADRPDWSPPGFSDVFERQLRGVAPFVDRWLTSSAHIRARLAERLAAWSLPVRPIDVLPMGWDSFRRAPPTAPVGEEAILHRHGIGRRPYILFVGTIEPRKNVPALLDAIDVLRQRLGDRVPALVIAGSYGWQAGRVRTRLQRAIREGALFWARNLTDGELRTLYRRARFTVMPSHGEGWGLAVQESIALGVPCIASSGGATPEAGRDLAVYMDPAQPEQLERAIAHWIVDESALNAARARIEQALETERFATWNDAAATLLRAARSAGGSDERSGDGSMAPDLPP